MLEEVRDILLNAWRQEKQIAAAKNKEDKSIKATKNWERLVRKILFRKSLEDKYLQQY